MVPFSLLFHITSLSQCIPFNCFNTISFLLRLNKSMTGSCFTFSHSQKVFGSPFRSFSGLLTEISPSAKHFLMYISLNKSNQLQKWSNQLSWMLFFPLRFGYVTDAGANNSNCRGRNHSFFSWMSRSLTSWNSKQLRLMFKGLYHLQSMGGEVIQITFNSKKSIVFNTWLSLSHPRLQKLQSC